MSEKSPFVDNEIEEDGLLLNEHESGKKNSKYESDSFFSKHWKILLSGIGVVFLISTGVTIGAIFNNTSNGVNRPARAVKFPYNKIRLPGNVLPIKYRLYLHPNITDQKFGFTGNVIILVEAKNDTDSIVLHSKGLKISKIRIFKGEDAINMKHENAAEKLPVKDFLTHKKLEFIMIRLDDDASLKNNTKYVIHIEFAGSLSNGLEGFYKSSYLTKSGEKR